MAPFITGSPLADATPSPPLRHRERLRRPAGSVGWSARLATANGPSPEQSRLRPRSSTPDPGGGAATSGRGAPVGQRRTPTAGRAWVASRSTPTPSTRSRPPSASTTRPTSSSRLGGSAGPVRSTAGSSDSSTTLGLPGTPRWRAGSNEPTGRRRRGCTLLDTRRHRSPRVSVARSSRNVQDPPGP